MATWKRQPRERAGTYHFSGKLIATMRVVREVPLEETSQIWDDLQLFIHQEDGIDRLQVYVNETGDRMFFVDQLSMEMVESKLFTENDNYCTLMFADEY